mgnify:CR=1 FL=1
MPAGDQHLKLELVLLPFFGAVYYALDPEPARAAGFALAYLGASLLLSPDLDLRHNDARRRWGVLGFIWIPYSKLFRHRGVSHSLLFGVLTRIGYLTALAALGFSAAAYAGAELPQLRWTPDWPLLAALAAGLYAPNVLHVLYDHWDTARKRRRSRKLGLRPRSARASR